MAPKAWLWFALLCCAFGSTAPRAFCQAAGAVKAAPAGGFPYAKEQAPAAVPGLAQKEADLRTALAGQPASASLLYALALVERQENKPEESLQTYTRAAKLRQPTAEELRSVAFDYVLLNDYEDAIHWLETAAAMDPSDPEVLYALGRCYYTKNRMADAEKMYRQVLALAPRHLKAEENLGLLYDATNRPQEAEAALRQAASWANPFGKDEWPFLDLGGFLLDHDRAAESLDPLQKAAVIQPASAIVHEKLGRAFLALQKPAAGIDELQKAVELSPRDPKLHFELGRALRQAGQTEQAKKEFALSQQLYAAHSVE